jgi:primary-amine oxidase
VWNWLFYQDGNIELEIRLTGILQVYPLAQGEPTPYGTQIAPGIIAQNHQHMFSVRIDPMVDGLRNSVVETDIVARPEPTGSDANFAGNGFYTASTTLAKASDGVRDFNAGADRRWRIVQPAHTHPYTGLETGYAILAKGAVVPFMPRADSWVGRRANFAAHTLWVVREREAARGGGRMWPAGKYVPQAREEPKDSVLAWVRDDAEDKIADEDVLVYLTVGTTHVPRPEDWPVCVPLSLFVAARANRETGCRSNT